MTKKATRVMLKGTEGNEDYLVIARKSGFVLGFKPLLGVGTDNGKFGCRLRMVPAPSDIPIAKTPANLEKMTEVFTGIPWHKRSDERFSTMLIKPVEWGIGFPKKIAETISSGVPAMFDEIVGMLSDEGIKLLNREDAENFAAEGLNAQLTAFSESYAKWKAESDTTSGSEPADVIAFPPSDDGQDV